MVNLEFAGQVPNNKNIKGYASMEQNFEKGLLRNFPWTYSTYCIGRIPLPNSQVSPNGGEDFLNTIHEKLGKRNKFYNPFLLLYHSLEFYLNSGIIDKGKLVFIFTFTGGKYYKRVSKHTKGIHIERCLRAA